LTGDFASKGGTLVIFASGSGYSYAGQNSPNTVSVIVSLDHNQVGKLFVHTIGNGNANHNSLISCPFVVTPSVVGAGTHTITLQHEYGTSDGDDYFNVTILELPFS
jgi:hypothetical protein